MPPTYFNSRSISCGLAMFSMFFGAGNIIFPLALGNYAEDQTLFAVFGLLITAVIVPFLGLATMIKFDGDYRSFFETLGKFPGFLVALLIITLLGPLGSTPRCITLAYSTIKVSYNSLSPLFFNAISCLFVYLFCYKKTRIIDLLGSILTPFLLASLSFIIIIGFYNASTPNPHLESSSIVFFKGLKEGYNTMDLLAAFFFSSLIVQSLKMHSKDKDIKKSALASICIGSLLLAATYVGFSFVASFQTQDIHVKSVEQLLAGITMKIMGSSAGFLVCVTIALTCLTTAIALTSVFAEFMQKEIFKDKIEYKTCLIITVFATFIVSNLEFSGIASFLGPILEIIYPCLIALTIYNLIYKSKPIEA